MFKLTNDNTVFVKVYLAALGEWNNGTFPHDYTQRGETRKENSQKP